MVHHTVITTIYSLSNLSVCGIGRIITAKHFQFESFQLRSQPKHSILPRASINPYGVILWMATGSASPTYSPWQTNLQSHSHKIPISMRVLYSFALFTCAYIASAADVLADLLNENDFQVVLGSWENLGDPQPSLWSPPPARVAIIGAGAAGTSTVRAAC